MAGVEPASEQTLPALVDGQATAAVPPSRADDISATGSPNHKSAADTDPAAALLFSPAAPLSHANTIAPPLNTDEATAAVSLETANSLHSLPLAVDNMPSLQSTILTQDQLPVASAMGTLSLDAINTAQLMGSHMPLSLAGGFPKQDAQLLTGIDASLQLQAAMQGLADPLMPLGNPNWNMEMSYPDAQAGLGAPFSDMPRSELDTNAAQTHAAFAKLEFNDGAFYMTTYAVELGRDMRAFQLAKQHVMETEIQNKEQQERSNSGDKAPETPVRQIRSAGHVSAARSFVSESGGIIGEDDELMPLSKRKRRKSQKSKSDESLDSQVLRKNSLDVKDDSLGLQSLASGTVDPNATARLDPAAHMGDPNYVPLIPIHPPNLFTDPKSSGKGISRKHVKIAFNFDTGKFEMHVFGRNGAFLNGKHYQSKSIVVLKDGSLIQIGGVPVRFLLPNQLLNDDGDHDPSESVSGRMSFSFEDGHGGSVVASDSGSHSFESVDDRVVGTFRNGFQFEEADGDSEDDSDDDDKDDDDEDDDDEEDSESEEKIVRPIPKLKLKAIKASQKPDPPFKRGPGRPPGKKTAMKLKLKMGQKQKGVDPVKPKGKGKEKDGQGQKAMKSSSKPATKGITEKKPKEGSKQPGKEPQNDPAAPEAKAIRVARDETLQNGVGGINIKDLPPGFVIPPRKKGPGRPPKDGIMSKRERQLLLKAAKEHEKALRLGLDPSQIPPPDTKPKPAPRRNSKGEVVEGDSASSAIKSFPGGDDKGERSTRPPRSPSPEMKLEDYNEEQLQRPTANYVVLIHEAITNSKPKKLNLQQIYSAIERRWPFFKFKVTSNGWQSSVRHNLGQHPAFKQVEKDGKGWLWGIADGVPIERERKKKASPPPQAAHHGPYGANQYPFGNFQPGRPGFNPPTGFVAPGQYQPGRPPTFVPPTAASQSTVGKPNTYSSPYDLANKAGGASGSALPHGLPNFHMTAAGHQLGAHLPTSRTPPAGQALAGSKWQQPSADLIETFRKVFVGTSIAQANGGMDEETATRIVDNAIKRVLDPESMVGVPLARNELAVKQAFESCLQRSSGPPKRISPGEPMPIVAGATARSMAQSAALTATTPTGLAATTPSMAGQPASQASAHPDRPAAANLVAILREVSAQQPQAAAPSTNPSVQAPMAAILGAVTTPGVRGAKANGHRPANIDTARANGIVSPTRPAVEPLTPPSVARTSAAAAPTAPGQVTPAENGAKRPLEKSTPESSEQAAKKLKMDG